MAHIREVRPAAREVKFVIDAAKAARIRQWARTHLEPDIHGSGPFGDEYRTTSVYFDTDAFDVFHRRGSFGRSKYRIRRYDDAETVFLERKMRQPAVLAKRRTIVALEALPRLIDPMVDADWPGHWFYRRVAARRLRPVCQVAYRRMARVAQRNGEQIRLTLDSDLVALPPGPSPVPAVHGLMAALALPERHILEMKYRCAPPAIFLQLVEEFRLAPQSASKYRLGVVATGQVAPSGSAPGDRAEAFYA
jgi:VTC domain